ncbi:MAG: Stp1/IreP family PP2C-type Ser/Thr phosphatase [Stomatobaculum sp.]|nr:Stp1/IreP family PP2C-type Ser/Thr phosphatase [Stomatobaculum sp.]
MTASAITDKGIVREQNQDTVFSSTVPVGPLPNLFMVADGMGGHQAGDYCSRMLISRIRDELLNSSVRVPLRALRSAIHKANEALYEEALADPKLSGMGSTLTAAFIEEDTLYVMNIGDSRLYVADVEDIVPRQVTRDHSYVEEMVSAGLMKRGSEVYNRNKNIITRAVGIGNRLDIDVFEVPITEETEILICSDGLTNMVSDQEIGCIFREYDDVQQAAEELIRAANGHGGRDNISVVLVRPHGKGAAV